MANQTRQILIESILGGQSPASHVAAEDQFRMSLGIDPSLATSDTIGANSIHNEASGLLRPTALFNISNANLNAFPQWIKNNPKNEFFYVYDAQGSVYTLQSGTAFAALSDGGTMSNSTGNGAAYYDNYMYFAKNTTIARYGPLNGTPAFNGDYWVTTLGKTELTNTTYPTVAYGTPNHIMHRHSDGRLYFGDVVGNQGVIHRISTTKTTVEGDTDDGSDYNILDFGFGLWPTAIESYGTSLVIALVEQADSRVNSKAKIAFWDTTSENFDSIIWVEFPDTMISCLKNINGTLYIVSCEPGEVGFRLSRYIGGNSVQEVFYDETSSPPAIGAVDGTADRILFGSNNNLLVSAGCVRSYGLTKSSLGNGLFTPYRISSTEFTGYVTALLMQGNDFVSPYPIVGWHYGGSGSPRFSIDTTGTYDYSVAPQYWWSQVYKIGQPYKITKIRIPLPQKLTSNMSVIPKIYKDSGTSTTTLTTINSTNFGTNRQSIVIRPENLTGDNDFFLELNWTGSDLCTVSLPITIEYELLDVDSTYQ